MTADEFEGVIISVACAFLSGMAVCLLYVIFSGR